MPEPLVTSQDIEARLGRSLTPEESTRVQALITDASAEVRAYTGQRFTLATSTTTLPVHNRRVSLPQRPVLDVDMIDGTVIEDPDLIGSTLRGLSGCEVTVTYRHGYAEVPDDIVAVVSAMVLRGLSTDVTSAMFSRESIGDYSYSLPESALARRVIVDRTDRGTLDRYRVPNLGALWLST